MRGRARARLILLVIGLGLAAPAQGFIPKPEKIVGAAARENASAGRDRPLHLEVVLRRGAPVADGEPGEILADGELLSEPAGFARLELRGRRGGRERHLLRGGHLMASRDDRPLEEPRPYLAPIFLLQVVDTSRLLTALQWFGVDLEVADLGRSHGHDCYVVGGRAIGPVNEAQPRPTLWIDIESHQIVGLERDDGVRFRFGPLLEFGSVKLPAWVWAEAPGTPPIHLEILGAAETESSPADFTPDWLLRP